MWCAELDPDGGVTNQVYFETEKEVKDFCIFKNGTDTSGVGMSFLWWYYEYETPTPITLNEAKLKYS